MQLNKLEQSSVLIAWFVNMNCYGVTLCGVLVLYATEWFQIYEALFPLITTEKKILVSSCSKGRTLSNRSITIQQISVTETYRAVHRIEVYPVDRVIHSSKNRSMIFKYGVCFCGDVIISHLFRCYCACLDTM